jgi:predicted GH43/DUF377 family glycosyl hydrolase
LLPALATLPPRLLPPANLCFDINTPTSADFYNPASFSVTREDGSLERWLMVRCENRTSPNSSAWSYGGPSVFAVVRELDVNGTRFGPLSQSSVVFGDGVHDVEDPRIVFHAGRYYMTYTQGTKCASPYGCARLSLASASNPLTRDGWVDHGPLWADVAGFQWTKSGAIVPSDDLGKRPHVMLWASWCTFTPWVSPLYMQVAVSNDMLKWTIEPGFVMDKRPGHFDSYVIEPGPPPQRLSDGNLLFVYNGATECPTGKPNYDRCYALGWAILNGSRPAQVLARSEDPILTPQLPWEIGVASRGDQTPNGVFIDGALRPDPGMPDSFIAHYGGSDTYVGAARVTVRHLAP